MIKVIKTSHTLHASAAKVWEHISKATNVEAWLPGVLTTTLTGKGEGAKRFCTTEQGDFHETIRKIDNQQKLFQYSIEEQSFLPVTNTIGTMIVSGDETTTELQWNVEVTVADEALFPQVKQTLEAVYAAGAKGLEALSQGSK